MEKFTQAHVLAVPDGAVLVSAGGVGQPQEPVGSVVELGALVAECISRNVFHVEVTVRKPGGGSGSSRGKPSSSSSSSGGGGGGGGNAHTLHAVVPAKSVFAFLDDDENDDGNGDCEKVKNGAGGEDVIDGLYSAYAADQTDGEGKVEGGGGAEDGVVGEDAWRAAREAEALLEAMGGGDDGGANYENEKEIETNPSSGGGYKVMST